MPELDPSDAALLASHERNHPRILALGGLLVVLGLGYLSWAVLRFDPRATAEQHASFDGPVSSLGQLYRPYSHALHHIRPASDTERVLLWTLRGGMNFSAGIMMTLLRIFLGLLLVLDGLFLFAIAFERRRLVQLAQRLLG